MTKTWTAHEFGTPDVLRFEDSEVKAPSGNDVTIAVKAAGVNPADYKYLAVSPMNDPKNLPMKLGYEVAGVVEAAGPDAAFKIGDEVVAFRVSGGYTDKITVPGKDVFAKPKPLDFAEAANLFLVGSTAADMMRVTNVEKGNTIVVHGASGAVGVSILQQARLMGVRCIGTSSEKNFETVARFGGEPVVYGDGLEDRLRAMSPDGFDASLDTVGTDEAIDVSLAILGDPKRVVTAAAFGRLDDGIQSVGGGDPESSKYRDSVRQHLIDLANAGDLVVPVAKTYPLAEAKEALEFLSGGHPGGKLALIS